MNDSVNIGYYRPTYLIYAVLGLIFVMDSIYSLIFADNDWLSYLVSLIFLALFGLILVYSLHNLRDKRIHLRLDGEGIWLRDAECERGGVKTTVANTRLAWQDIQRIKLRFPLSLGRVLDFYTADGACYRADILEYGIWRTRKLARKIQALHQAAPEQRARLLAEF